MRSLLLGLATVWAITNQAKALVTLVTTPGGQVVPGEGLVTTRSGAIEERFNSPTAASTCVPPSGLGVDLVGAQGVTYDLANNSVLDRRLAPRGDTSCYLTLGSARPQDSLELDFAGATQSAPLTYLGFYWGSADPYNHIAFFNASGAVDFAGGLGTQLSGSVVASALGVPLYSSNFVEFTLDPADQITYAIVSTDNYAFEIDNIAFSLGAVAPAIVALPEPATCALFGFATVCVGLTLRRRA